MFAAAALLLLSLPTGFAYESGYGAVNGRPLQSVVDRPSPVENLGRIAKVSISADHALALRSDGSVLAWGNNNFGQLGRTQPFASTEPLVVPNLPPCIDISAGPSFSMAVTTDGRVFGWGANSGKQLGPNVHTNRMKTPIELPNIGNVVQIAAGNGFVLALRNDGAVYSWGANSTGQLGDGTQTTRASAALIPGLGNVVQVSAGGSCAFAVKDNGFAFGWGFNNGGYLGVGSNDVSVLQPRKVVGLHKVAEISAGGTHTLARRTDGKVLAWGTNEYGQLGDPEIPDSVYGVSTPVIVRGLSGAVAVAAQNGSSAAVRNDGKLLVFGKTNDMLPTFKRKLPTVVPTLPNVFAVSVGYHNTVAVSDTQTPFWLSVSPGSLVGGYGSAELTIHLEEASSSDHAFETSSLASTVGVQESVFLPAGSTSVTVPLDVSTPTEWDRVVKVRAALDGIEQFDSIGIVAKRLTVRAGVPYPANTWLAGDSGSVSVSVSFPAPAGGLTVYLANSHPDRLSIPASIRIPAGAMGASAVATTTPSVNSASPIITATANRLTAEWQPFIQGTWVASLTQDSGQVLGGGTHHVKVKLAAPAPAEGLNIAFRPYPFDLVAPESITIPAGETEAEVSVETYPVNLSTEATLTSTDPFSQYRFVQFTISPPSIESAGFSPDRLRGGDEATLTIKLNGTSAGETVTLTSGSSQISFPASVVIPAGATQASVTVQTSSVAAVKAVFVNCNLRTQKVAAKLVLEP